MFDLRSGGMENENIKVTINGEEKEVPSGMTILQLLDHLRVKKAAAIVEHNLTVLKSNQHEDVKVSAGDNLEIVRFVGGG